MLDKKIIRQSLPYSGLVILYIAVVATVMQNAPRLFGQMVGILAPIVILMLLVVSASVVGLLIFGKPVMLYLDGKKREAVSLVIYIVGNLAAAIVLLVVLLAIINASGMMQ
jgi:hypothetical protein